MVRKLYAALFALLAFTLQPMTLDASGTYPPAPPRLRADITQQVDPELYNLGKLIFAGRAKLEGEQLPPQKVTENRTVFAAVISQLPERAQARLPVAELAAQLNDYEARALLYYLQLRFRLEEASV